MGKIPNRVIIWATDNYNSLALLRQVSQGGCSIDFVIHGRAGITVKSRYIQKYVETQNYDEAFKYLMDNYVHEDTKPIILTSGDGIIAFIDQHKAEIERLFVVPGTTVSGLITKYNDKYEMTQLAAKHGIVVPQSYLIRWDSETSGLPYPLMVKPSHEQPGRHNEFKFKACRSEKELQHVLGFVQKDSVFIAQQLIEKEKDLLVYGARMWDGKVVLAGSLETDRFATGQGSSFGRVVKNIPSCINSDAIEGFLNEIDYYGLFSFEYGLKEGKAYFFEVNLRNDGTSSFFFQSGANIALAYVYSSADLDYSKVPTRVTEERWYMDEVYDCINVKQGHVSKQQWEKERAQVTAFKFRDEEDMEPYNAELRGGSSRMLRDRFIARYRLYILWMLNKIGIKK